MCFISCNLYWEVIIIIIIIIIILEEIHWSSLRLGKFSSPSGAEALTDLSVAIVKNSAYWSPTT